MLHPQPLHQSVLVVGASGRTGNEVIRELHQHASNPYIHAFCRDANKLATKDYCTSIVEGDAVNPQDLEWALTTTRARVVILAVGNGDDNHNSKYYNIRTASARALAMVLRKPDFQHGRVVVVSCLGAGNSRVPLGFGVGKLIEFQRRRTLKDYTGQEQVFLSSMESSLRNRSVVVRADKSEAARSNLAKFVVSGICDSSLPIGGGRAYNLGRGFFLRHSQ